MSAERLREELRALPGVAEAEIDGDGDVPSNVRVRLHPEADPGRVGVEVQRVLASHGMRSRVAPEDGPSASVVSLPVAEAPAPPRPEAPPPVAMVVSEPPPPPRDPSTAAPEMTPNTEQPRAEEPVRPMITTNGLASIAVEESSDGVAVVATATDGRRFSQRTRADDESVSAAVVAVVGALATGTAPRLLSVSSQVAEGAEAVTVVVQRPDGRTVAGAAVVAAGRPYAVARATWAALTA